MIISDVMVTSLVTVTADDSLSHAANLLRQYQFHHLPVVRKKQMQRFDRSTGEPLSGTETVSVLEGILSSKDIDLTIARGSRDSSAVRIWQELTVGEVMSRSLICVTPTTSLAAAAQMLVDRNVNCLPVVEYEPETPETEDVQNGIESSTQMLLVGMATRSDLLLALARAMGTFEPGMQLTVLFPEGHLDPLARLLLLAREMRVPVRSVIAAPQKNGVIPNAMVRLGTINPAPLLRRLQEENIRYVFVDPAVEGISMA